MPENERRFWPNREKHQHILGEVIKIIVSGKQVRVLMLYEKAVERDQAPAEMPKIRCQALGDIGEITCSICDRAAANWSSGQEALEIFIDRLQKVENPAGLITKEEARKIG